MDTLLQSGTRKRSEISLHQTEVMRFSMQYSMREMKRCSQLFVSFLGQKLCKFKSVLINLTREMTIHLTERYIAHHNYFTLPIIVFFLSVRFLLQFYERIKLKAKKISLCSINSRKLANRVEK